MDLSVVIPAFNSELTISKLVQQMIYLLDKSSKLSTFEIIIVDDSSNDETWNIIQVLTSENPGIVRSVQSVTNLGQHRATLEGMKLACGNIIITIDDDLQIPPEEIFKLLDKYHNTKSHVVYGVYSQKKHNLLRNFGSALLTYLLMKFGNLPKRSSSFRLINREVTQKLITVNRKFYFLEGLIPEATDKIAYENVRHLNRLYGKSNYSAGGMFLLFLKIIGGYTSFRPKMISNVPGHR